MLIYSRQSSKRIDLDLYKSGRGINYIYTQEGQDFMFLYQLSGT
jgi:hypothetical protein